MKWVSCQRLLDTNEAVQAVDLWRNLPYNSHRKRPSTQVVFLSGCTPAAVTARDAFIQTLHKITRGEPNHVI